MYRVAMTIACVGILALAGCPGTSTSKGGNGAAKAGDVTLFFTGDVRGQIEPCGCNSNPLGDLSRLAALVEDAEKAQGANAVAWFDGGSLLFSQEKLAEGMAAQERLKAQLILAQLDKLRLTGAGLGQFDLADGKAAVLPARQAANLAADQGVALAAPRVVDVGGVKVGVFGLADPASLAPYDLKASDPVATAEKLVPELQKQGAQVIVALTQMNRTQARSLAEKKLGIDFVVAGRDAPDPTDPAGIGPGIQQVGDGYLIQPAQRGQSVVRVQLHVDPKPGARPIVDAVGEARAQGRIADLDASITDLEQRLAAWKADPTAEKAFIERNQAMIEDMKQERAELAKNPVRKPAAGSWLTAAHILVERRLRCDPEVVAAKRAFDKAAAEKNIAASVDEKPAPAPEGQASYVGDEECGFCHKAAVDVWKGTHHAQAWDTLVKLGKDANRDCVSCHVTGWERPGGSVLGTVVKEGATLRNVQCESCHGPGSKHVDADGKEKVPSVVRAPEEKVCLPCHTPDHSDTFEFKAYLRDVTGKGHGEDYRKRLGDGPTGRQLRKAALEKAAQALGEGCDK